MLNEIKLSASQSERLALARYRCADGTATTEDQLIATLHGLATLYAGENEKLHIVTAEMTTGLHKVSVCRTLKEAKGTASSSIELALQE